MLQKTFRKNSERLKEKNKTKKKKYKKKERKKKETKKCLFVSGGSLTRFSVKSGRGGDFSCSISGQKKKWSQKIIQIIIIRKKIIKKY